MRSITRHPILWAFVIAILLLQTNSTAAKNATDIAGLASLLTQDNQFDYVTWTLGAVEKKIIQNAIGMPYYLNNEQRKHIVTEYLRLTRNIEETENAITQIYADPTINNKEEATAHLREQDETLIRQQVALAPYAEAVLQEQVSTIAAELGLTIGGQPIPPILYHISPLPLNLVISPRKIIEQETSVSLLPGLTSEEQEAIETKTASALDRSTLVVPVGGIGVYPTMVMRTTDQTWLSEVVAHEWTHNYLTLRPLGLLYDQSPELRTMNETTASIAGKEIGHLVIEKYYPELLSWDQTPSGLVSLRTDRPNPNDLRKPFDFRKEMHETRIVTDKLLSEGKIVEAEAYMEERRKIFWENGYTIRKLNQAYFAFYGAYADIPGGAAGEDPVGPAVRSLREQSSSLADFINKIAWMTSFDQLKAAVNQK
jgi:hypothetical protein